MLNPNLWLLVAIGAAVLGMLAQLWVKGAFHRWSRVPNSRGLSGSDVAAYVLRHAGVAGVAVERAHGWLSDHYDPRHHVLRLSPAVHDGSSVAAAAIAAHEAGHAMQHARRYAPLALRSVAVPIAGFGSQLALPLFVLGMLLHVAPLMWAGVLLFAGVVVIQLITLPVEFDASRRAKAVLAETGIVGSAEEAAGVRAVLTAAALTYVAATVQAIAWFLRFLAIAMGQRRHG